MKKLLLLASLSLSLNAMDAGFDAERTGSSESGEEKSDTFFYLEDAWPTRVKLYISVDDATGLSDFVTRLGVSGRVDNIVRSKTSRDRERYLSIIKKQNPFRTVSMWELAVKNFHAQLTEDLHSLDAECLMVVANVKQPQNESERSLNLKTSKLALIQKAAKYYFRNCAVVTDPKDYNEVISKWYPDPERCKALAAKALKHVINYQQAIVDATGFEID